jgi:hypothetical protein
MSVSREFSGGTRRSDSALYVSIGIALIKLVHQRKAIEAIDYNDVNYYEVPARPARNVKRAGMANNRVAKGEYSSFHFPRH